MLRVPLCLTSLYFSPVPAPPWSEVLILAGACFTMEEKDRRFIRLLGVLSTVGITMVVATVIGYFAGLYLDRFFDTSPWLMIVFLVLGIAAGFKNLFDQARKVLDLDKDDRKGNNGQ